MDINKCAEEILNKNIRKYQDIFYVPKIWMKHIINKNICKKVVALLFSAIEAMWTDLWSVCPKVTIP